MFPPCESRTRAGARNYRRDIVRSDDAWMLDAFVLPVGKFDAAEAILARTSIRASRCAFPRLDQRPRTRPRFSRALARRRLRFVRLMRTMSICLDHPARNVAAERAGRIAALTRTRGRSSEICRPSGKRRSRSRAHDRLARGASIPTRTRRRFGFKMRTGGVTRRCLSDVHPDRARAGRAGDAAGADQIHRRSASSGPPVSREVQTKMHGFLNVLGAAVLAAEHVGCAANRRDARRRRSGLVFRSMTNSSPGVNGRSHTERHQRPAEIRHLLRKL